MKDKIFQKLKQTYSALGLGDEVLMLHAQTLDGMGIVTDDNLESVVNSQKSLLEGLQKANDKRAADAVAKTKAELEKKHEEEMKKKADDEAKKAEEEARKKAEEEAERKRKEEMENEKVPESVKKMLEELKKQNEAVLEQNKKLSESHEALLKEHEAAKAVAAKQARQDMILGKARELGIPQARIEEGFVIADDATEDTINNYLSKVAKNSKAAQLPSRNSAEVLASHEATKEEIDAIASALVG